MHGELAQLVALSAHGSAYLSGAGPLLELFPGHSTFRFVAAVEFHRRSRTLWFMPRKAIGDRTGVWLTDLHRRGLTTLHLVRSPNIPVNRDLPPHIEAGFANGLDVALVARGPRGSAERWTGAWLVSTPEASDQRIWSVRYCGEPCDATSTNSPDLETTTERLRRAFSAAREIAFDSSWHEWAEVFKVALAELAADAPTTRYHPDLLPVIGFGLPARQLIAAVSAGWVLGGMGSWNDLAAQDEEHYNAVTRELHAALLEGTIAATNSFSLAIPRLNG